LVKGLALLAALALVFDFIGVFFAVSFFTGVNLTVAVLGLTVDLAVIFLLAALLLVVVLTAGFFTLEVLLLLAVFFAGGDFMAVLGLLAAFLAVGFLLAAFTGGFLAVVFVFAWVFAVALPLTAAFFLATAPETAVLLREGFFTADFAGGDFLAGGFLTAVFLPPASLALVLLLLLAIIDNPLISLVIGKRRKRGRIV
jgi:hypothetical protein